MFAAFTWPVIARFYGRRAITSCAPCIVTSRIATSLNTEPSNGYATSRGLFLLKRAMTRRQWMFWKREEPASSALSRADIEGCREWTPFLTGLFDGEASEEEALQARRHLVVCERCARAWLDWNQTRSLLINQLAPPAPPPNLLWRIRLACRLGQPKQAAAPELGAQILALTSRQNAKPSFWSSLALRARFHSPFIGAMAVGAFVVFMARGSLFSAPPQLQTQVEIASVQVRAPRLRPSVPQESAPRNAQANLTILAPRVQVVSSRASAKAPRAVEVVARKPRPFVERARVSLARARREREALGQTPIRLVSLDGSAPLPMLAPPRVRPVVVRTSVVRPSRPAVATNARSSRPVALSPRDTTPAVVLASAPVTPLVSESSRAERAPRVFLALAPAPLRISAPRAHPITMGQPPTSDDSGLDDLDSTVEEYRATLIDDSDPSSDAG